jgi:hypothetical protein
MRTFACILIAILVNIAKADVTFCGEIQGVIHLHHNVNSNLAQSIAFLNHSTYANLKKVKINRTVNNTVSTNFTVNVERIVLNNFKDDVKLQDHDIIHIPSTVMPLRKSVKQLLENKKRY